MRHLAIFIGQVNPVRRIDTRRELDTVRLSFDNMVRAVAIQENVRKRETIYSQIQKRTARQFRLTQAFDMRERHRKIGLHTFDLTDFPRRNPVLDHLHCRQESRPHRLAQENALFFGKGNDLGGHQRIRGKRLFDKQIPACVQTK